MEETGRQTIMNEGEEEDDARNLEAEIRNYAFGVAKTAVLKCAIDLGIAEAIENHGSSMTISDLSSTLKCDPSLLQRLMRFLVHNRIFKQKPTSQGTIAFEQTPVSRCLMRNAENSLASLILLEISPAMTASWQSLAAHIQSNRTSAFEIAHGKNLRSYIASDSSQSKLFNDAMACTARISVQAIIKGCPEVFDWVETLVDVGGGDGTAINMLVKAFPWIKGINFDLPHVVNVAAQKCHGVEHVAGDMFDSIPRADAIFLKRVLHGLGDDECIKILKKCREAIPKDKGKVLIVDIIIDEEEHKLKSMRLMLDMVMMANSSKGRERTLKEWDYVLRLAGFDRYIIKSINAIQSLIEAFP